jgi:hypothetical protein
VLSVALTNTKDAPIETPEGILPAKEVAERSILIGKRLEFILLPTPNCPTEFEPQVQSDVTPF